MFIYITESLCCIPEITHYESTIVQLKKLMDKKESNYHLIIQSRNY